jgi:hypothetical protein
MRNHFVGQNCPSSNNVSTAASRRDSVAGFNGSSVLMRLYCCRYRAQARQCSTVILLSVWIFWKVNQLRNPVISDINAIIVPGRGLFYPGGHETAVP